MKDKVTLLRSRDVNYGVAFEVARDMLLNRSGEAFRAYIAIRDTPGTAAEAIAAARECHAAARREALALRVTDFSAIRAVLADSA